MMKRCLSLFASAIFAWLAMGSAQAVVLSGNMDRLQDDYDTASNLNWLAQQFTTGGQPYVLNTVTLSMSISGTGSNLPQLDIYSGDSSKPTTLVATLTPPASYPVTFGPVVFTSSGLSLAAGTVYWVVLHTATGNPRYNWAYTLNTTGIGAGFSPVHVETSGVAPPPWPASIATQPYLMAIDATAAPTPPVANATQVPTLSEWSMIALSVLLALGAVITFRRRRR